MLTLMFAGGIIVYSSLLVRFFKGAKFEKPFRIFVGSGFFFVLAELFSIETEGLVLVAYKDNDSREFADHLHSFMRILKENRSRSCRVSS